MSDGQTHTIHQPRPSALNQAVLSDKRAKRLADSDRKDQLSWKDIDTGRYWCRWDKCSFSSDDRRDVVNHFLEEHLGRPVNRHPGRPVNDTACDCDDPNCSNGNQGGGRPWDQGPPGRSPDANIAQPSSLPLPYSHQLGPGSRYETRFAGPIQGDPLQHAPSHRFWPGDRNQANQGGSRPWDAGQEHY
ncbi:hypothetical protein JCM16303_005424 [Sporobolomyces ruberrimus]